ncbi:Hypothetical predicted protein, partial [Paramuricea clavata]
NPSPKNLGEECGTLSDAEKDCEIDYVHDSVGSAIPVPSSPAAVFNFSDNLSPIFKESPCKGSAGNNPGTLGDIVQNIITAFKSVACPKIKGTIIELFIKAFLLSLEACMALYQFVQADFLDKSLNAMKTLLQEGKNLLYGMSWCFER